MIQKRTVIKKRRFLSKQPQRMMKTQRGGKKEKQRTAGRRLNSESTKEKEGRGVLDSRAEGRDDSGQICCSDWSQERDHYCMWAILMLDKDDGELKLELRKIDELRGFELVLKSWWLRIEINKVENDLRSQTLTGCKVEVILFMWHETNHEELSSQAPQEWKLNTIFPINSRQDENLSQIFPPHFKNLSLHHSCEIESPQHIFKTLFQMQALNSSYH